MGIKKWLQEKLSPEQKKKMLNFGIETKKSKADRAIKKEKASVRQSLEETPTYEIPEEAQQLLDLTKSYGQQIEGLKEYGQKSLDIAQRGTSQAEMPGMGIAREQIQGSVAGSVQNILEAGGGGVGALGAIAQVGQNELNAMRDLSMQNQQFQRQAQSEYQNALMNQAGLESSLLGQSSQIQSMGLEYMGAQKGMQYESELSKTRGLQQFDIGQLGNMIAEEQARREKNAKILTTTLSTIGTIVGSIYGGPAGGAAGGAAGKFLGKGLSKMGGGAEDVAGGFMNFNVTEQNPYGLEAGTFGSGSPSPSGFQY